MLDGFWIIWIEAPQYTTGGVCVFINQKLFGGDNGFTWTGAYSVHGALIKGRVRVHNFDPSVPSALGIAGDYDMHFSANLDDDTIKGTAILANQPQHNLSIRLVRQANL